MGSLLSLNETAQVIYLSSLFIWKDKDMYNSQHSIDPEWRQKLNLEESIGLDFALSKLYDLENLEEWKFIHSPSLEDFQKSVVCITGTLESMTRQKITKLLKEVFFVEVRDTVSSQTDYLICGKDLQQPSIKLVTAYKYGTPLISENNLLKLFYEKQGVK